MKKFFSIFLFLIAVCALYGASYSEQMAEADKLFKAKKYKEAAAAYDDASLETENAVERINARYRNWESLSRIRSGNAVTAAENLLYDESGLDSDKFVKIVSYITGRGQRDSRSKALEFALKRKDLSEFHRSRILLCAINNGGTFQSEKYIDEILSMSNPAPVAKAHALGHRANIHLWVKKDYPSAIKYITQCLEIKELSRSDRQFFTLVKARAHLGMRQIQQAESCYLHAIASGSGSFLDAAYKELLSVYIRTKQGIKIEPLLREAAKNKKLSKKQREEFGNAVQEIEKRRAAMAQQKGEQK